MDRISDFCVCEDVCTSTYQSIQYTHLGALILVSLVHSILSKCQNQISTFILMSTFIIWSGVNSGHGIGDFCVCEDEHFVCTSCQSILCIL